MVLNKSTIEVIQILLTWNQSKKTLNFCFSSMDQPIFYVECPREENKIRERRLKVATDTKRKGALSLWAEVCMLCMLSRGSQDSLQQTAEGAGSLELMDWEDRTPSRMAESSGLWESRGTPWHWQHPNVVETQQWGRMLPFYVLISK